MRKEIGRSENRKCAGSSGVRPEQRYFWRSGKGAFALALIVLVAMVLSLRFGSSDFSSMAFWGGLLGREGYETQSAILRYIRLPRLLGAVLAGIGLSLSGVLLQSVTANPLASPSIIGVNSGAGFFAILCLSFLPGALYALPFAAFIGAFGATLLILAVAGRIGSTRATVVLAGIALTALLNAGISFLSLLDSDVLLAYHDFSVGGLASVRLQSLAVPGAIIALSFVSSLLVSRQIQLLCLGDSMALSLGVRVKTLRMLCLVCASAAASAVVSFAGLLGFVGLVVPHIARKLVGEDTKFLLIFAALLGAALVLLADLLGRVLLAPAEVPVGIIMAVLGAPFFFALLLRRGGKVHAAL